MVNIEAEDTAVAILKYANGSIGVIEATTSVRPYNLEGSISILGSKGSVVIEGFAVNKIKTWEFVEPKIHDKDVLEKYSENPPNVYGYGHQAYYEHVVDCIKNKKDPWIDGKEARKSLRLLNALYRSIETGVEINLNDEPKSINLGMQK